jgi:hypothetical protein
MPLYFFHFRNGERALDKDGRRLPDDDGAEARAQACGLNPLGAWISATTYQPDDLATHQGSTWRAKSTSLNQAPTTHPTQWAQLASKGDKGARQEHIDTVP